MSEGDKSVTPRKVHLLSCDARDVNKVSTYAAKRRTELQEISNKFTNMGYLRRVWDSKVPEVDKKFYYFFTLTQTNCANVLEDVKKYETFYKELTDALHKISTGKKPDDKESSNISNEQESNSELHEKEKSNNNLHGSSEAKVQRDALENSEEKPSGASYEAKTEEDDMESEIMEPYEIILQMNDKLSKMTEDARLGKELTASSEVYNLHKSFIEKHKKLEHMIKRVECVALKQGLKKAIDGWKESKQSLKKLETDLSSTNKKCDEMNDKLDQVIEDNRILREIMKKYFLEDNKKPDSASGNSAGKESDG